jgi:hypothetical protein
MRSLLTLALIAAVTWSATADAGRRTVKPRRAAIHLVALDRVFP